MATRAEVDRLRLANAELSKRVQAELAGFFRSLNLNRPEAARDALLAFMPALTQKYGDVAAVIAMDWYEDVRESAGKRAVQALAAPTGIPAAAVEAKVRYSAGALFTPRPELALPGLLVAVDKYVKQPGRSTIAYNADRNGQRWARVPSGAKTCAFCLLLAGREGEWLYTSSESALFSKNGNKYHGACDCQVIAVDDESDYPEDFNPREAFEMYSIARDESGSGDIRDILQAMRRTFPDQLKDGVHAH